MVAQPRDPYSGKSLDERFYAFNENAVKPEQNKTESDTIYDLTESILSDEESSAKNALSQLWDLKNQVESEQAVKTIDTLIDHYQNKIDLMRSKEKRIRTISEDSRELLYEKMKSEKELKAVQSGILKCKAGIETLQMKLGELEAKEHELSDVHKQLTVELENNNSEVINGLYAVVLSRNEQYGHPLKDNESKNDIEDIVVQPIVADEPRSPFPLSKVTTKEGLLVSQYYMNQPQPTTTRLIVNSTFFGKKLQALSNSIHSKSVKTELILSIRDMLKRVSENTIETAFELSLNEIMNPQKLHTLERAIVIADTFHIKEFSDRLQSKLAALGENYYTLLIEQMNRV